MSWWQTLKEANKLDLAKEILKVVCKTVPGGAAIASTIEGYENLQDEEVKRRSDEIPGTIATNGKEILELAQYLQERVARKSWRCWLSFQV